MELCSEGHKEVCYETRFCPACALVEEIKDLKAKIEDLEDEIKDME